MAINREFLLALVLVAGVAESREAASPAACQAAAQRAPIAPARAAVDHEPNDLPATYALADAWSDAGCFTEAAQALQDAAGSHPDNRQLQTRLRVARSLVGEEHFFDNIDRADAAAKLKRDIFRCSSLADSEACKEASRTAPNDPAVLSAQAEAASAGRPSGESSDSKSPAPASASTRRGSKAPVARLASNAARLYSNAEPEAQSH